MGEGKVHSKQAMNKRFRKLQMKWTLMFVSLLGQVILSLGGQL